SAGDLGQHDDPGDEGDQDDAGPDPVDEAPSQTHTGSAVDHAAQQRHSEHDAGERSRRRRPHAVGHSLSSLRSSTSSSRPIRKIWVISARPTTTSAAATTMTMKANTWPSSLLRKRPKVMKA